MKRNTLTKQVVIIGAGYTGLTAALRLAQRGHNVTVLEKGPSLGGLAGNFSIEGAPLEKAYHHLFKTDTSIIKLADELGIGDKLKWHDSSVAIYYDNKLYPFKGALDLLKFSPLNLFNRLRAGLTVLYLQKNPKWQRYTTVGAYEWMRRYAGKQVTEVIWEPLLKGKFDNYYDKVAMAWLWARIHVRAKSREAGGEKLGYFDDGFQAFTDYLVISCLENGVSIRTDVDIESIKSSSGGVTITISGSKEQYDSCIATVPSHVFARLIANDPAATPGYLNRLQAISYLGARIMVFSSTQQISQYYWHNINDTQLPFLVFINHTRLVSKKLYNGKHIYYIATYVPHNHKLFTCSEDELKTIWFKSLKKVFPDFDPSAIREVHSFALANAQHIVDTDYHSKIPKLSTPLRNVYLSNFSQIFPEDRGTNFAVKAGEEVARTVDDRLSF